MLIEELSEIILDETVFRSDELIINWLVVEIKFDVNMSLITLDVSRLSFWTITGVVISIKVKAFKSSIISTVI